MVRGGVREHRGNEAAYGHKPRRRRRPSGTPAVAYRAAEHSNLISRMIQMSSDSPSNDSNGDTPDRHSAYLPISYACIRAPIPVFQEARTLGTLAHTDCAQGRVE